MLVDVWQSLTPYLAAIFAIIQIIIPATKIGSNILTVTALSLIHI